MHTYTNSSAAQGQEQQEQCDIGQEGMSRPDPNASLKAPYSIGVEVIRHPVQVCVLAAVCTYH